MTVRTWFRLLRRSHWETDGPILHVYLATGNYQHPFDGPHSLISCADYQRVIQRFQDDRLSAYENLFRQLEANTWVGIERPRPAGLVD